MKNAFWVICILVLVLSFSIVISCGDDDDDDDDDDTNYPIIDENGLGSSGESQPGASSNCTEESCTDMLNMADECGFPCQDMNGNSTKCINLLKYCVTCEPNWDCDVYCYEIESSCNGFLNCGAAVCSK